MVAKKQLYFATLVDQTIINAFKILISGMRVAVNVHMAFCIMEIPVSNHQSVCAVIRTITQGSMEKPGLTIHTQTAFPICVLTVKYKSLIWQMIVLKLNVNLEKFH